MILVKRKCHNYDVRFIVMLLLLRLKTETVSRADLTTEYNNAVIRPKIPPGSLRWVFQKMEKHGLVMLTYLGGRNKCYVEMTDEGRNLANCFAILTQRPIAVPSIKLNDDEGQS